MLARQSLLVLGILGLWSEWNLPVLALQTFFPSAVPRAVHTDLQLLAHHTEWDKLDGDMANLNASWAGPASSGSTESPTPGAGYRVSAIPTLLNVTFLSPVEPSDWGRQSFPFSYLYVEGTATDCQAHSIHIYSYIAAEWVSVNLETGIEWNTSHTDHATYCQVKSTSPTSVFTDAEDSVAYHVISSAEPNIVSIVGSASKLRQQFAASGEGFRLLSDLGGQIGIVQESSGEFRVFAHALDLGTTSTISTLRGRLALPGTQSRHLLVYRTEVITGRSGPLSMMLAITLNQKILGDAANILPDYVDLVSLGKNARQWPRQSIHEGLAENDRRVNPTEVIYAVLPALIYLNASITGALLKPLLEYQNSSNYTNPYAAPDLGTAYPAAPGDPDQLALYGVEGEGLSSSDGSLIGRYYNLLKQWPDYLHSNALITALQYGFRQHSLFNKTLSPRRAPADRRDTALGQNQGNNTNLALEGIIAIRGMAEIIQIMSEAADAQKYEVCRGTLTAESHPTYDYSGVGKNLIRSWVKLKSASGLLGWTYGYTTFGLMYNLLADKLFQLDLVPESIFAEESTNSLNNATQIPRFGFPLGSSTSGTRPDWTLFSAAAALDTSTHNLLISAVRKHASFNSTNATFPTRYDVETGLILEGFASVANKTVVVPPPAEIAGQGSSAKSHTGAIVGGIIGGLAAILFVGGIIVPRRRRGQRGEDQELEILRPYTMTAPESGKSTVIPQPASSLSRKVAMKSRVCRAGQKTGVDNVYSVTLRPTSCSLLHTIRTASTAPLLVHAPPSDETLG
ncbi:hypothetical protein K438DRAFT_1969332 [Mycena galopus ATCC 62051]|nr:hypothetical protein K438DRAFT_1969332 [Mycena galopus ATCC 62051]